MKREKLKKGRPHLTVSGTFQSDKYKWCPPGFVPLKITDYSARLVLKIYAHLRSSVDGDFERDLMEAIYNEETRTIRMRSPRINRQKKVFRGTKR